MSDKSVIVPIDFSDCSTDVVNQAVELGRELSGRVVLLHVIKPPRGVSLDAKVASEGEEHTALELLRQEARGKLPRYEALVEQAGLPVEVVVELGDPAQRILHHAGRPGARFIVMGTHGRTGLSRLMLGSTAETVMRGATVPVITVRFQHKASCDATSCAWCATGVSEAERQLGAEADG